MFITLGEEHIFGDWLIHRYQIFVDYSSRYMKTESWWHQLDGHLSFEGHPSSTDAVGKMRFWTSPSSKTSWRAVYSKFNWPINTGKPEQHLREGGKVILSFEYDKIPVTCYNEIPWPAIWVTLNRVVWHTRIRIHHATAPSQVSRPPSKTSKAPRTLDRKKTTLCPWKRVHYSETKPLHNAESS